MLQTATLSLAVATAMCIASTSALRTSCPTCHMSHVTRSCHTSHVTCHTSHVTRHMSHITRHTLNTTNTSLCAFSNGKLVWKYQTQGWQTCPFTLHYTASRVTCHTSRLTSHVMRHASCVTCHTSHLTRIAHTLHTSHFTRHTSQATCSALPPYPFPPPPCMQPASRASPLITLPTFCCI